MNAIGIKFLKAEFLLKKKYIACFFVFLPKYKDTLATGLPVTALQLISNFSPFLYWFLLNNPWLITKTGLCGGSESKKIINYKPRMFARKLWSNTFCKLYKRIKRVVDLFARKMI